MCLLPSSNPAGVSPTDKQKESSSDDDQRGDAGNLELPVSKDVSVYMKVSKFASDLNSRPRPSHIIRSLKKEKK